MPKVLVVDDTPANLDVVNGLLSDQYQMLGAISGTMALKVVEQQQPDLVLLDIMMPEMDGYEVCERLKASEETRDIPVIFLTAKRETEDEARGFALGAVDYITKPINPPLLKTRVRTHLLLKQQKDQLRESVSTNEMDAAYHRGIAEMGSHLFHNIGNVAVGLNTYLQHLSSGEILLSKLIELLKDQQQRIERGEEEKLSIGQVGELIEQVQQSYFSEELLGAVDAIHHLVEILDAQRNFVAQDPFARSEFMLSQAVEVAVSIMKGRMDKSKIDFMHEVAYGLPSAYLPKNPLQQVVINLLKNASEAVGDRHVHELDTYGKSTFEKRIRLHILPYNERQFEVVVEDNGIGFKDEAEMERILENGYTTKNFGTGQGLSSIVHFVKAVEGELVIEHGEGGDGARFRVRLPYRSD